MGKDRATTMMNLVPPVGWSDVVTTRDLELHRAETKQDLLELWLSVDAEMTSTRHEIATAESRLGRTFAGWLFASQAAVIGAMAVLLAID